MHILKAWLALLLLIVFVAALAVLSRKYISLYACRKSVARPPVAELVQAAEASNNPELLLAEANRLAWVFNWPKAEPLYVRAEELFREKGDKRDQIYARVGRIRAQSETMSFVEVSKML